MPEYKAKIRNKKKGVNVVTKTVIASCYSDAEKIVQGELSKGEYVDVINNVSHGVFGYANPDGRLRTRGRKYD
jgi:hypothetical protein